MTDTEYSEMFDQLREADARIAALETEFETYRVVKHRAFLREELRADTAEARLAAVIGMIDAATAGDLACPICGLIPVGFWDKVRAAATGEQW